MLEEKKTLNIIFWNHVSEFESQSSKKKNRAKLFFCYLFLTSFFMFVAIFQFSVLSFHFLSLEGGRREKTFGTEFKQHLKCSECAISLSHNSQMSERERERESVCAKEVV